MKVTFLSGAGGTVIPSRILLRTNDDKDSTLLECGDIVPEKDTKNYEPDFSPVEPSKVGKVITSHAHTDHVGALCSFVRRGFNGGIVSTAPNKSITEALLFDNYEVPLVDAVFERYESPKKFLEEFELSEGVYATFYPAQGHILGASSILFRLEKLRLKVLFSGDLGNTNKKMLSINGEVPEADIVIMESTYGRKEYHLDFDECLDLLHNGINETYRKSGNFIIPVLSIHKIQEALYHVNLAIETGKIPEDINVAVDSKLGEEITRIYSRGAYRHLFSSEAQEFFNNHSITSPFHYSNRINKEGRNVILASSGLDGLRGRFKKHLGELSSEENSIAMLSHMQEGSLLENIAAGKGSVGFDGKKYDVNAKTFNLSGFSSHADATQLLNWFRKTKAKYVFLVHGEDDSRNKLKEMIVENGLCPEERIFLPALMEEFDLSNLPKSNNKIFVPSSIPTREKRLSPPPASKPLTGGGTVLFGQRLDIKFKETG